MLPRLLRGRERHADSDRRKASTQEAVLAMGQDIAEVLHFAWQLPPGARLQLLIHLRTVGVWQQWRRPSRSTHAKVLATTRSCILLREGDASLNGRSSAAAQPSHLQAKVRCGDCVRKSEMVRAHSAVYISALAQWGQIIECKFCAISHNTQRHRLSSAPSRPPRRKPRRCWARPIVVCVCVCVCARGGGGGG